MSSNLYVGAVADAATAQSLGISIGDVRPPTKEEWNEALTNVGLGADAITLVAPNPYTAGISGGITVIQAIRHGDPTELLSLGIAGGVGNVLRNTRGQGHHAISNDNIIRMQTLFGAGSSEVINNLPEKSNE